ncbi:MAG TPA: hypothetical protein VF546_22485 [Pyrinomonadaceae bacterium]|jgi:hypothetical protein
MDDTTRKPNCGALCDALRAACAAPYALLPPDAAHRLGDLKKNFWGAVGWFADKNIVWVDEVIAESDRLRARWQQRRAEQAAATADAPQNPT